jgi:hypothetical protein
MYATPVSPDTEPTLENNCPRNQMPIQMNAGIGMMKKKTQVKIGARGNMSMYAPKTPAIAPDAPTSGTAEPGKTNDCAYAAATPHNK